MEPSSAIAIIENDLRFVVADAFSASSNTDWLTEAFGKDVIAELILRRDSERRRRAPFVVTDNLLSYAHLGELRSCIKRRDWQMFFPALGKRNEFELFLNQVSDFRNAVAHSRELLPHERALLEGISGIIRTRVTLYKTAKGPDMQHYPMIESATDSFGNSAEGIDPEGLPPIVVTGLTLEVGQIVTFTCRGWDPQGRELSWAVRPTGTRSDDWTVGSEVTLSWTISDDQVGSRCYLDVDLLSLGKYHRHQTTDQSVSFLYSVAPPLDV